MGDRQELQRPEVILQNPLESPPELPADPPDFSVLRIHSSPPSSSTAPAVHRHQPHSPCSSCGCAGGVRSRKRPSPPASLPAKKLFLDHAPEHRLFRSTSDPDPFRAASPAPAESPAPAPKVSAVSPATGSGSVSARSSLPPRPPALRRATSDPTPSTPVAPKALSRTSSSASDEVDRTPNSKTSKMLSHWREINLWMEDFIRDENSESENPTTETTTTTTEGRNTENDNDYDDPQNLLTNTTKEDCAAEFEESLSVERDGERLHIHFKCHCGKGYQFLLADGNCFYKLM